MVAERRQAYRFPGKEQVKVDVISEDAPNQTLEFECFARDLSKQGIRLHGHQDLQLHAELSLKVHMKDKNQDYQLSGKIKWVTETTEREVIAGVELSDEDSQDWQQWQKLFDH